MINLTDFERKLVQIVRNRKLSILSKLMNCSKQEIRETLNKLKEKSCQFEIYIASNLNQILRNITQQELVSLRYKLLLC